MAGLEAGSARLTLVMCEVPDALGGASSTVAGSRGKLRGKLRGACPAGIVVFVEELMCGAVAREAAEPF
ncbi:MAG TPA: hypothetical protein VMH81_27255 [Bryobacteraceae bacterium]|nr:hypothetical protein [Bryobacteraceae bacterium]